MLLCDCEVTAEVCRSGCAVTAKYAPKWLQIDPKELDQRAPQSGCELVAPKVPKVTPEVAAK